MNKLESQWKHCHSNVGHRIAARGAVSGPSKESQDAGTTQAVLLPLYALNVYSQVLLENTERKGKI